MNKKCFLISFTWGGIQFFHFISYFVVLYCYFLAAFSSLYVNDVKTMDRAQAIISSMNVQSQPAISAT